MKGRGFVQHSFSLIGLKRPATNPGSSPRPWFSVCVCVPGGTGRGQPTLAVSAAGFVGGYVRKEKLLRHVTAFPPSLLPSPSFLRDGLHISTGTAASLAVLLRHVQFPAELLGCN